ncbi:MAG: tetratricopeptide repeat protein [Rhodospirillaceae bacterium]
MSDHGNIKFWTEIGRRNVLRVAMVYAGFAWFVIHSGVVLGEALELPHWIMRLVSILLVLGGPVVVAFAWVFEYTPEGFKRAVEVEKDDSLTHRTARRLDVVIIVLIVVLAGMYGADRYLLPHETAEGNAHIATEGAPKAPAGEGISIAVLPFLNLSGDPQQEFFSDGMTEEITSALAKVKGLRVVGRTSAFEFKGQNKDLRAIGKALSATDLIEGSVRKDGNEIRITAQLIRADDGTHIWTESYNRELKGVFAIQEEIATAIAVSLRVPLGLKPGDTLVRNRTDDAETYDQYLRAKALVRSRSLADAIALLEPAVARDAQFAPAWALLAYAYALRPAQTGNIRSGSIEDSRRAIQTDLSKAGAAARQAIQLDSRHSGTYVALAYIQAIQGKWAEAEDSFKQALTLDPDDPDALQEYSVVLANVGRIEASLSMRERLLKLEPLVPIFKINTAEYLLFAGRTAMATQLLEALPSTSFSLRNIRLAHAYAKVGRYAEAADTLLASATMGPVGEAERLLRTAPVRAKAPASLPALDNLSFVYAYVGALDRVMDYPERLLSAGFFLGAPLWYPEYGPLRKTDRFKALMRRSGLVDYWRARGWPDLCHPVGADDFACN